MTEINNPPADAALTDSKMQAALDEKLLKAVAGLMNSSIYTILYKQGPMVGHKHFVHTGDKQSAIKRAQAHCEQVRVRFIHCSPFISNLNEEEARFSGI